MTTSVWILPKSSLGITLLLSINNLYRWEMSLRNQTASLSYSLASWSTKNLGLCKADVHSSLLLDFSSISPLSALVNHSLHLISISIWDFPIFLHLMAYFNPLKTEFLLNNIYKYSSNLTGNILRHRYKAQPVNAVWGNSRCLLWEPYGTHKYTLWAECGYIKIQSVPHRKHITSPLQSPTC
jgi:hypothetical protein